MSIYQLYGSAGSAGSLANFDVQFNGVIVAVSLNGKATFSADGDFFGLEVSFLSSQMMNANDARGIIFSTSHSASVVTSGGQAASVHKCLSGISVPVVAGERIYLHLGEHNSAGTVVARAILYVEDSADVNLRRRR